MGRTTEGSSRRVSTPALASTDSEMPSEQSSAVSASSNHFSSSRSMVDRSRRVGSCFILSSASFAAATRASYYTMDTRIFESMRPRSASAHSPSSQDCQMSSHMSSLRAFACGPARPLSQEPHARQPVISEQRKARPRAVLTSMIAPKKSMRAELSRLYRRPLRRKSSTTASIVL